MSLLLLKCLPAGGILTIVNFVLFGVHVSGAGSVTVMVYKSVSVGEVKLSRNAVVWLASRLSIVGG